MVEITINGKETFFNMEEPTKELTPLEEEELFFEITFESYVRELI